jgi:hypothetical protein
MPSAFLYQTRFNFFQIFSSPFNLVWLNNRYILASTMQIAFLLFLAD